MKQTCKPEQNDVVGEEKLMQNGHVHGNVFFSLIGRSQSCNPD